MSLALQYNRVRVILGEIPNVKVAEGPSYEGRSPPRYYVIGSDQRDWILDGVGSNLAESLIIVVSRKAWSSPTS